MRSFLRYGLLFVLLGTMPLLSVGQEVIKKGQTRTITAEDEAKYIMSETQFTKAIAQMRELELIKQEEIPLLEQKIEILMRKDSLNQSLIKDLSQYRDHYQKRTEEYSQKMDELIGECERKDKQAKFAQKVALFGIPGALVIGILIGIF